MTVGRIAAVAWVATLAACGAPSGAGSSAAAAQSDAEIFRAAGFTHTRGRWESGACGNPPGAYEPGVLEYLGDINSGGRPEALLRESGVCYGNIGQRFWLLSRQANGHWRVLVNAIAIPEPLTSRGVDGYTDILGGGPGFCFPVARWNGEAYALQRHEYEGRPCPPP